MHLVPISAVAHEIRIGMPLRFGVRDQDGNLLLAKDFVVANAKMLDGLMARGVFVDMNELAAAKRPEEAPAQSALEKFIDDWERLHTTLEPVLRAPHLLQDTSVLLDSVTRVITLSEVSPDLLIFLILRHDQTRYGSYGVFHALHVAAVASLIACRLKWSDTQRASLVGAGLTMNLPITDLQGRLAMQRLPLSSVQREQLDRHPGEAAGLLRQIGITDEAWLTAVERHHELPEAHAHPVPPTHPDCMSHALRYIDIFIAKLSARATRLAELPNVAARKLFMQNQTDPLVAAVIKEFGIYPPGCYVKLVSGELAIVTRRGAHANTPVVAALTNTGGYALLEPVRRDTAKPEYAIAEIVGENAVFVRPNWHRLYALCFGRGERPPQNTVLAA